MTLGLEGTCGSIGGIFWEIVGVDVCGDAVFESRDGGSRSGSLGIPLKLLPDLEG